MTKIDIKGEVLNDDWGQLYDSVGWTNVHPKKVQDLLDSDEDGEIVLDIASGGGDVFAASEIYTMLKSSGKKVTANIQGLAASAASVISMAGDVVRISPTAQMMIHNAWSQPAGNADDLRHEAITLDSIDESIVNAYEIKTGLSRDEIALMMSNTTFMSAQVAVDKGFADEIMFVDNSKLAVNNSVLNSPSIDELNKFKNMILKQEMEKQNTEKTSQPKISLRDQKLAILRAN